MEDFAPFIFFIIYAIFQVFSSMNKAKKKQAKKQQQTAQSKQRQPQRQQQRRTEAVPKPKPQSQENPGDFFKEFMKQLEELESPKPASEPQPLPTPEPVVVSMETIPPPAVSKEITVPEYSNLELNILDKTHKSKFEHHSTGAFKKIPKRKPIKLFKNVDAREAFIYSLIFDRKEY